MNEFNKLKSKYLFKINIVKYNQQQLSISLLKFQSTYSVHDKLSVETETIDEERIQQYKFVINLCDF